jgi:hypothetical protein
LWSAHSGTVSSLIRTRVAQSFFALALAFSAASTSTRALAEPPRQARSRSVIELCDSLEARSERERVMAAAELGRSGDPRAVPALIQALRDHSEDVRAVAADALGQIGDDRARAGLRRATRDKNAEVRRAARAALHTLRAQGHHRAENRADFGVRGFQTQPPAPKPNFVLSLRSVVDVSPLHGSASELRRVAQKALAEHLSSAAERERGPVYQLDLALQKQQRRMREDAVEYEVVLRASVADAKGRMLSFVTGSALVSVPRQEYRRGDDVHMQREALENAMTSLEQDLIAFLRQR